MGFSNQLVLCVVLGESLLISMLGGLAGLGFGWLVVTGVGQSGSISQFFPVFFIPNRDLLVGLALAVLVGFAAGAFPAVQAMRLRLAEALRREG
jgi:putative ABC transport system permease protein